MKENDDFEKDPLWDILGKAEPVKVSPFFTRNVLRAVRLQETSHSEAPLSLQWKDLIGLVRSWRPAVLGGLAAGITLALFSVVTVSDEGQLLSMGFMTEATADTDVIINLDELLAMEETSVWLDSSQF